MYMARGVAFACVASCAFAAPVHRELLLDSVLDSVGHAAGTANSLVSATAESVATGSSSWLRWGRTDEESEPYVSTYTTENSSQPKPELLWSEKVMLMDGVGYHEHSHTAKDGYYIGNIPPIKRLGLPSLNLHDASQGVRTHHAAMIAQVTSWPCALAAGGTWDPALVRRWGVALGHEFLAKGVNVALAPGVNVARVARGGRNAEYLGGESAHLASRMAATYIEGMQSTGVRATVKHFGFNNQETNRNYYNARVDERTAFEVYYPPFEAAFKAGVAAVMCAYNLVNGTYACGSKELLTRDLRERLGFDGFVMSDWWAVHGFGYQNAGLDMLLPGNRMLTDGSHDFFSPDNLAKTSEPGVVDTAADRVLAEVLRAVPTCTPPYCGQEMLRARATSDEHVALSRQIATESVALLKNGGRLLPLQSGSRVALVGSACDARNDIDAMLRQWNLANYYTIGGSGRTIPLSPASVAAGLRAAWEKRVEYAGEGPFHLPLDPAPPAVEVVNGDHDDNVDLAVAAMERADVAIVCGATTAAESEDRPSLLLDQSGFIGEVLARATIPTVLVAMTPGAVLLPFAANATAIVHTFLAGQETGHAIADVLLGRENPSGKLPVTIPLSEEQTVLPCQPVEGVHISSVAGLWTQGGGGGYGVHYDCDYTESLHVGYLGLHDEPVGFPFGHGLSYTSFGYEWAEEPPAAFPPGAGGRLELAVRVSAEEGPASGGREVVQLYLSFPEGSGEPRRQLKGFVKTESLAPGEGVAVALQLTCRDLSIWSVEETAWVAVPGAFLVEVGSSSRDLRLEATFTLAATGCSSSDSTGPTAPTGTTEGGVADPEE